MIAVLGIIAFAAFVGGNGPAYTDWRDRRRAMFPLRKRLFHELRAALTYRPPPKPPLPPAARVVYLPSGRCRGPQYQLASGSQIDYPLQGPGQL